MHTVLHLIETSGPGGAEKVLIQLVERLDKKKYKSIVCLLKSGWLSDQLSERRVETIIIPQPHTVDLRWLYRATRLTKTHDVALMHSHEFAMNTYGSLVSLLTGIPCIATVHGKNYYTERWHRRAAYRFVSKRARMVAVCEDIKQFLVDQVSTHASSVETVHNGIDVNRYAPQLERRDKVRKELGLSPEQPVIGTIGNLYPVKGHSYLLEAAAAIVKRHADAIFLFVGRGRLLNALQNQSAGLALDSNVIFLGFKEDIVSLLDAIDIFVLPSLSEGLPLSLLEAMAAGRPVVASNVGGIPEVVVDGETGFLVPPGKPGPLADAILTLLGSPDTVARLAKLSRKRVIQEFDLRGMIERYEQLYQEALG